MNAKHDELLRKLEQFQLDSPEAALPFSAGSPGKIIGRSPTPSASSKNTNASPSSRWRRGIRCRRPRMWIKCGICT